MALLTLDDVHKAYDHRDLLDGVSLVIEETTRIGIVGANGCGKSTLIRLLAGLETPDSGRRTLRPGLRIGHLIQEVPIHEGLVRDAVRGGLVGRAEVLAQIDQVHNALSAPGLTPARTQVLLDELTHLETRRDHLGGHDVEHRVEELIAHVGLLDPDAPAATLSGGEQRRVALARLLLAEPDVLLLDEPTNHLDAVVIDWLEDQLLAMRTPLVMVTHDRYFLDRVVDRVIEMDRGTIYGYDGGYAGYLRGKAAREQADQHAEAARQNLLRRETEWMRRGPPARTTKADARIDRYHHLLDDAPPAANRELAFRIPAGPRLGDRVLRLRGVTLRVGDRTLVEDLDLDVGRGTRLGIVGPNGAGKSTLLRALLGERAPDAGTVERGETVRFASIDQHREDLDLSATVLQEVAGSLDHVRVGDKPVRVESFLDEFLFPGDRKLTRIEQLSGGERNRVLLAKLLLQMGNVLVLDEPTNDLDLPTLRALEEALQAFDGTVIVVSHDRWFLDRVATEIVYLDGAGRALRWAGDMSSLLARVGEERAAAEAAAERARRPAPAPRTNDRAPKSKGFSSSQRRELDEIPAKIEAGEARLAEIDARMGDPALYRGTTRELAAIQAERAAASKDLDRLYARWEQLEALRAAESG